MNRLPVLYEDSKAGMTPFGPHELAIACVADALNLDRYEIKKCFTDIPKKGDSKVREALRSDLSGENVVVVFDLDRIRTCYQLPKTACKTQILNAIQREAAAARVVLIEQNMDDLVQVCRDLLGCPRFVTKPRPNERDATCQALAMKPALFPKLLEKMPTFARLVRLLESHASDSSRQVP